MSYPDYIKKSVAALIKELKKSHPHLTEIIYSESDFKSRMEMGLYIELIRAGIIK